MKTPKQLLPILVISQFCCTSLWFAGNGVIDDLIVYFSLNQSALGHLTSAVQFGFISGTLTFAILTISDRFSPSKVFFMSAVFGAVCNLGILWKSNGLISLLIFRFFTGFFLAGIYPVGMKIATDYFKNGLGKSLGYLVGALVLGTAFPHFLNGLPDAFNWKSVLICTSSLALFGGVLMFAFVPNGPYRQASQQTNFSAFLNVFKNTKFRAMTVGYFGHTWELYSFWAFLPVFISRYSNKHPELSLNTSLLSFSIIGIGGLACVLSGSLSKVFGVKKIALISLCLSCLCCVLFPFIFNSTSEILFFGFLFFWGMVVIADSPLLSTLIAQNAPVEHKGTALTIVNCIGFLLTIVSIQCITYLMEITDSNGIYSLLAIGPVFGVIALKNKHTRTTKT